MTFYGTQESLTKWRALLAKELSKIGSKLEPFSSISYTFTIDLTTEERQYIQDHLWYETDNDHDLQWNHRIAFEE